MVTYVDEHECGLRPGGGRGVAELLRARTRLRVARDHEVRFAREQIVAAQPAAALDEQECREAPRHLAVGLVDQPLRGVGSMREGHGMSVEWRAGGFSRRLRWGNVKQGDLFNPDFRRRRQRFRRREVDPELGGERSRFLKELGEGVRNIQREGQT